MWGSVLGCGGGEGRCGERCEEERGDRGKGEYGGVGGSVEKCTGVCGEIKKDVGRGVGMRRSGGRCGDKEKWGEV